MNLLSELENLAGENLCSAVLRLLLLRSHEIRTLFLDLLSREYRSGPLRLGSHFACLREQFTDDSGRRGRLDILIETSNAVIGLENKLHAGFQEGQPHKYFTTIEQYSKGLSELRKTQYRPIIAVLAPQSRTEEIKSIIGNEEHFLIIKWEELFDYLSRAEPHLDHKTKILLQELQSYVYQQITVFPDFTRQFPHLRRKFEPRGTPLQRELVGKLWQFFPDPGSRLSSGNSWVGYYFTEPSKGTHAWYGFVPEKEIKSGVKNTAELIIATSFMVPFQDPPFREIELTAGPKFIGASEIHAWAVDFDENWHTPEVWREKLKPLWEAYESVINNTSKTDTSG